MLIWLADAVIAAHLAYLAFIPAGGFIARRRPRVVWLHLAAVAVGVLSITIGFDCPLTTWEQELRRHGGQHAYTTGFVDHYLRGRVFPHGFDWAVQALFGACVVVSYALIIGRDRRLRGRRGSARPSTPDCRPPRGGPPR